MAKHLLPLPCIIAVLFTAACGVRVSRKTVQPVPGVLTPVPLATSSMVLPSDRPALRIAFIRNGDVYLLNSATGTETRLTDDGGNQAPWWTTDGTTLFFDGKLGMRRWSERSGIEQVRGGLWSPDGRSVAFSEPLANDEPPTGFGPPGDVWVESNGQRRQITPSEPGIQWGMLAWSPDSRRLALGRLQLNAAQIPEKGSSAHLAAGSIWVATTDDGSGDLREIAEAPPSFGGAPGLADVASWSPDGRFLLVGSGPNNSCASCRADGLPFYAVPAAGGTPVKLDSALSGPIGSAWAPDGSFVILSIPLGRETYGNKQFIRFNPITGAGGDILQDPGSADIEPAVSPDGREMAFVRGPSIAGGLGPVQAVTARHLWIMRTDESALYQIDEVPGWTDDAPVWSPDGRWLLFVRWHRDGSSGPGAAELWAARADGSETQRLVANLGAVAAVLKNLGYYGNLGWQNDFAVAPRGNVR